MYWLTQVMLAPMYIINSIRIEALGKTSETSGENPWVLGIK